MSQFNSSDSLLLVEDDEVDILDIKRIFRKNNISNPLHIARNGVEALNKLEGKHGEQKLSPLPKIILLDINMPKMNGLELLKHIRSIPELQSTLVFVLTSSNAERDKVEAYRLNVAGYVIKPMHFSDFIKTVGTLKHYWTLLEFPERG